LRDKFEVVRLRMSLHGVDPQTLFRGEQEDTLSFLRRTGFSEKGIQRFFAPFFGGVTLDNSLRTSSRFFKFLFQCFAEGNICVPRQGMEMIPRQMAAALPHLRVLLNSTAIRIEKTGNGRYAVDTAMRETVEARTVVMATDAASAHHLLVQSKVPARRTTAVSWNGTTTYYYAAKRAPVDEPILLLNGEGLRDGPVNHAAVMSNVSAEYAPAGAHLVCANVVGRAPQSEAERAELEQEVRTQMRRWFGQQVGQWEVVGGYFIPHALPMQRYAEWEQGPTSVKSSTSGRGKKEEAQEIFLCGDYCETASIQGALASGRRTAEAVAASLPERAS
jgi:phytoene dehydrogenase-like protein